MIKLDKNIPIPDKARAAQKDDLHAVMEQMAEGDSFVIPPGIKVNAIRATGEKLNIRVKIGKDEFGKRRCWRKREMKNVEKFEKKLKPEIKEIFQKLGIFTCELRYEGCKGQWALTLAHSKRRRKIENDEELAEVIVACIPCHLQLDHKPHEETERIVKDIISKRGK